MRKPAVRARLHRPLLRTASVLCSVLLVACGGSGDGSSTAVDTSAGGDGAGSGSGGGTEPVVIEGQIERFGVVNVADAAGQASDAIAAFYRVTPSVNQAEFGGLSAGDAADCRVVPAAQGGNTLTSSVFLPAPIAAAVESIRAGETVGLMSAAGSWSELAPTEAGGMVFYSSELGVPDGVVPESLTADVSQSTTEGGFPGFMAAALPAGIAQLADFSPASGGAVSARTTFTWQAGSDPSARVLIGASESFFADGPLRVACVVPDTGSFAFPAATRSELGDDFAGAVTGASRLVVRVEQDNDSLLFLIRESSTD